MKKAKHWILIFSIIIATHWICSLPIETVTDEGFHTTAGYLWWTDNLWRDSWHDNSMMPISAVNVIPMAIIKTFPSVFTHSDPDWLSRKMTVIGYFGIIIIVFLWLRRKFNIQTATVALALFSIEPNLIPYSQVYGTDIWGTFFALWAMYSLYLVEEDPRRRHWICFFIILAIAQLSKQSNIWLYPLFGFYMLIRKQKFRSLDWKLALGFVLIQCFIISMGYRFTGEWMSLSDYHFSSGFFRHIQQIPILDKIPLPLPQPFLRGLDMVSEINRVGGGDPIDDRSTFGSPYLLGVCKPLGSFWYYYFVVLWYKTQIPILILCLISFFRFRKNYIHAFPLVTLMLLFMIVYFNFFYKTQLGIRHIILFYPLLFLVLSPVIIQIWQTGYKWLVPILWIWGLLSMLNYRNDYIPFTNEFLLDKKMAYTLFSDCNIYWWEKEVIARQYAIKNHYDINPTKIQSGRFLINPCKLTMDDQGYKYQWIRDNYRPIDIVFNSYLLYDIPDQDLPILIANYPDYSSHMIYATDVYGPIK